MSNLSETASDILILLNNINELIVKSSDRNSARKVMSALKTYAKAKNFEMPEQDVANFFSILLDAKPYTTTLLLKRIAEKVATTDYKSKIKKPRHNIKIK